MADEDFGLRDALGSRLKSQFFGGLVLSWFALHWRLVYVSFFEAVEKLPFIPGTPDRYATKLEYLVAHCCEPWHVWLPLGVAMFAPLAIYGLDKTIEYLKGHISEGWAWVGEKRDPKSFVTYEQFAHLAKRIKVLEEELREAQVNAVNAQTSEAETKNELAAMTKAKTDLENNLGLVHTNSEQFKKFLTAMRSIEERFGAIRINLDGIKAPPILIAMETIASIEHDLRELKTIHLTTNDSISLGARAEPKK